MNTSETVVTIKKLSDAFPYFKITEDTIKVYVDGLDDIDSRRLSLAANEIIKNSEYFPKVVELRKAAMQVNTFDNFDNLMADYQEIVDSLRHDPDEYLKIAEKFEKAGRLYMAESIKQKVARVI